MSAGLTLSYHIVPPLFLIIFTSAAQYLAQAGNPDRKFQTWFILGNCFAWKVVGSLLAWALLWLWIPSKKFPGPTTSFGYTPIYQANGELYYVGSLAMLGCVVYINPTLCVSIYQNMGPILGVLNVLALSLCTYLLIKAKLDRNPVDPYLRTSHYPVFHEFYRGMELHPRLLGVDVKQLTNCRMGMIMWQLLILIYFGASYQLKGFDPGHLVNVTLQTLYIYKFYRWETGYFNTLDITLDRAGYYLCWGCLVWVPSLYTFHSYFFVYHQPQSSIASALVIFSLGIAMIYFNYDVDRQKELFSTGRPIKMWGKKAEGLKVTYTTSTGDKKTRQLLVSGWWGLARKINYSFELGAALAWSIPAGFNYGIWPFIYFLFLLVLLIHRIFRDEEKCKNKYGNGWVQYCKKVPYRLIPHVF